MVSAQSPVELGPHRRDTTEFGIILPNEQRVPSSELGLALDGGRSLCKACAVLLRAPSPHRARPCAWEPLFTLRLKTKSKACKYLISLACYCLPRLMCEGTPCAALINSAFRRPCRAVVAVPAVAGPMQRQRRPALCSQS